MSQNGVGPDETRRGRTVAGLMLAPIAGATLSGYAMIVYGAVVDRSLSEAGAVFGYVTAFGLMLGLTIGVPIAIVLGMPAFMLMKRWSLCGWISFSIGGGVIAVFAINLLLPAIGMGSQLLTEAIPAGLVGLAGAIGGMTFWLIRRPDRDAATTPPR